MTEELGVSGLLRKWGMKEDIILSFQVAEMDEFALQHLDQDTLKDLIPSAGQRIRFNAQRNIWLKEKQNVGTVDEEPSLINMCDFKGIDTLPIVIMDGDDFANPVDHLQFERERSTPSPTPTPSPSPATASTSVSASEATQKRQKLYDLRALLSSCPQGQKVLAKAGKELDDMHRNYLASIIIDEELRDDLSRSLSYDRIEFLAAQITEVFPKECKDTWVSKSKFLNGKVSLKGKLYVKYYNRRRGFRSSGLLQPVRRDQSASAVLTAGAPDISPEIQGDLLWLTQNTGEWSNVTALWKKTSKERRQMLEGDGVDKVYEYTRKFPALAEPEGYQLLEIDFVEKYTEERKMLLFREWTRLSSFVVRIIRESDPEFLQDADYTQGEKIVRILLRMSDIFAPITVSKAKRVKGSKQWRPSRADSQEAFLLHLETAALLHERIEARRSKLGQFGYSLQPQPVIIGPIEQPTQFLVVVDNFHYSVNSALTAVDVAFKVFQALHTEYPPEAIQLWQFLQRGVYGIETVYDKVLTNVSTRLAQYKAEK